MVVIMLEKSTPSQRGEMSRLTLEIKSGVFIANLNARVRDKLWEKICKEWNLNSILLYILYITMVLSTQSFSLFSTHVGLNRHGN